MPPLISNRPSGMLAVGKNPLISLPTSRGISLPDSSRLDATFKSMANCMLVKLKSVTSISLSDGTPMSADALSVISISACNVNPLSGSFLIPSNPTVFNAPSAAKFALRKKLSSDGINVCKYLIIGAISTGRSSPNAPNTLSTAPKR